MEYLHQAFAFSGRMQGRRICHYEGRLRPWQSRAGTADPYWLPLKWHVPIASVAALTAQPLAALPPYGCGVPFTGGERHWQLQIPAHSADRTRHSRGADSRARRKTSGWYRLALKWHQPPNLSLRGGRRPTWQSREGSCEFAGGFPVFRLHPARLPRLLRSLAMTNLGVPSSRVIARRAQARRGNLK